MSLSSQNEMHTLLVLPLELLHEVIDQSVIEILATQVGITGSRLDLEDTFLDCQQRHIESSSSEIKNENVPLANDFLIETVSNGSCGGLVDDAKDVQPRDRSRVFGGLPLRVVEVCRDRYYSVVASRTQGCF